MVDAELIGEALDRIDKAHRQDPAGRALEYARRMTRWLERLAPHPSAALAIAVRAQHLRRWEIPRAGYPEGRSGYLRWRRACARHHADKVGLILNDLCAPAALIERVAALVRKEGLGRDAETQVLEDAETQVLEDAETQVLEDAACLSFLEAELAGFAEGRDSETLQRVLGRTWGKMSQRARELAASLDVRPPLDEVIGRLRPPSGQ